MHDVSPDETTKDISEESFTTAPIPLPIIQTTLLEELQRTETHAETQVLAVALPPKPPRVSKMFPLLGTLFTLTEIKQATL